METTQVAQAQRAWPDRIRDLVRANVARPKTMNAMIENGMIATAAMMAQTAASTRSDIFDTKLFMDVEDCATPVG